jgi:hypothetical protein
MALLPNVRDVDLYGVPYHSHSLRWRAKHGFRYLKSFTASATDDDPDDYPQSHDVSSVAIPCMEKSWRSTIRSEAQAQRTFAFLMP